MEKDGQAAWLVRLYEKTVNGIRNYGKIPAEADDGVLTVSIPTVAEQARALRYRDPLPPGHGVPSGVVDFLE